MLLLPGGCGYFFRGLLVAALGDDLAHRAPARELDRNHPGVADDLAAEGLYFLLGLFEVVHFDGEVMDAGPSPAAFDSRIRCRRRTA